jgi:hypothetical protein
MNARDRLTIRKFAHLVEVDLTFGDLTVLVGPQAAGKSLALQWLKLAVDGRHVTSALRDAGQRVTADTVLDLVLGSGMGPAWRDDTQVEWRGRHIEPKTVSRQGGREHEALFFIPAHRAMLVSDGWAAPFQKLGPDVPVVARLFSQNLFDRFSDREAGTLFPVPKRLKREIRKQIDRALFHGGTVGIEEDAQQHTRRLRLIHGKMHLPYMTWTAGQREFTPLLLGLYHLLPPTKLRKREDIDWVVIEEPEMGLHPRAITVVLLLVLDLLWRGYRVVLSTHSPHVLAAVWMLQRLKEHKARWQLVCGAFEVERMAQMRVVAEEALRKDYRVHYMFFDKAMHVRSKDISSLDVENDDDAISGWGGLAELSSRFGEAVRRAVNEAENAKKNA